MTTLLRHRHAKDLLPLIALGLSTLLASLGMSVATVALPDLTRSFDASLSTVQWVLLSYMLAMTVLIVGAGRLGDMLGRRRLLLAGIFVFTLGATACAFASSLWVLITARAVQGAGAAIMMALTMAVARESLPENRIGTAMGLFGTSSAIGTALGPTLGGVLIGTFGWPAIFLSMAPLGALALLLGLFTLPYEPQPDRPTDRRFDGFGMALLALTLMAYALGLSRSDAATPVLLIFAIMGVASFVVSQQRSAAPLIPVSALKDKALNLSFAMNCLVAIVMMATLVVAPFYLTDALGLAPAHMGLAMSTGPIASALTGLPAGRLVDRFGASAMTIAGLIQMTVGAVSLIVMPATFGLWGYVAAAALMPPGYQLFLAANNTRVMTLAPSDQRGLISALLNLSRNIGLMTGTAVMSLLFVWVRNSQNPSTTPEATLVGFQITFGVAALLTAIALGLSTQASRHNQSPRA